MKAVRLTLATGQQVAEHGIGQILDFDKRCSVRLVNIILSHDLRTGAHREISSGSNKSLTEVAVVIREFEHGYAWLQPVFLARDPLLGTTAGP